VHKAKKIRLGRYSRKIARFLDLAIFVPALKNFLMIFTQKSKNFFIFFVFALDCCNHPNISNVLAIAGHKSY
jgi:hypothetical protein